MATKSAVRLTRSRALAWPDSAAVCMGLTIRPVPGYESEELSTLRNKLFANLAPDQSLLASAATSLKRPFMAGAERLP
jgi:hypothetical protein